MLPHYQSWNQLWRSRDGERRRSPTARLPFQTTNRSNIDKHQTPRANSFFVDAAQPKADALTYQGDFKRHHEHG